MKAKRHKKEEVACYADISLSYLEVCDLVSELVDSAPIVRELIYELNKVLEEE